MKIDLWYSNLLFITLNYMVKVAKKWLFYCKMMYNTMLNQLQFIIIHGSSYRLDVDLLKTSQFSTMFLQSV